MKFTKDKFCIFLSRFRTKIVLELFKYIVSKFYFFTVKSFILSHLMNLQQSTSTSSNSVRLRQILRNKPLSSFYANGETPNPLKYSTHFGYRLVGPLKNILQDILNFYLHISHILSDAYLEFKKFEISCL